MSERPTPLRPAIGYFSDNSVALLFRRFSQGASSELSAAANSYRPVVEEAACGWFRGAAVTPSGLAPE
jgi:hypothetical protein